jgi:hypothetical protein
MKAKKELLAGIVFILLLISVVWLAGGAHGLLRVGITILFAWIALYLLNRKSIPPKAGAMILNPDLLVKFLMPRKYRTAIKELEEAEKKE